MRIFILIFATLIKINERTGYVTILPTYYHVYVYHHNP